MGSACTKSNEQQVMQPQTQMEHAINTEFSQFMQLTNPYNVNHKYQTFCTYLKSQNDCIGTGIKRTHGYKCKITKEQLLVKRREFWETRVEGNSDIWKVLKMAVETDEKNAFTILSAGGIKLVNKSLQIAYDETGHKYDVPIFCINDPITCETEPSTEKNLTKEFQEQQIHLVFRCAKLDGQDLKMDFSNNLIVEDIKKQFLEKANKDFKTARFFVSGREIMNHHKLGFYQTQIPDNCVVSVLAN